MISQHADAEAYTFLLNNLQNAIYHYAELLLSPSSQPRYPANYHEQLRKFAHIITDDDGFVPSHMMIDGDDAERLAIEQAFPGLPVRVCQFHLMQACKSQARSVFGRGKLGDSKTGRFLARLRRCQRCPIESEWTSHYQQLRADIDDIANDGGEASTRLTTYWTVNGSVVDGDRTASTTASPRI